MYEVVACVFSDGGPSPRTELLHNIDTLAPKHGSSRNGSKFDNRVTAAIRVDKWKLVTGNPGADNVYD